MSTVHFIDTCVLTNLLNIPERNQQYAEVVQEFDTLRAAGDSFVFPIATLIETGNHISHVKGQMRWIIADKFSKMIECACETKDQMSIYPTISTDELKSLIAAFPNGAAAGRGFGDLSIEIQFNKYFDDKQPIGKMHIWSLDGHLAANILEGGLSRRKNR